MTEEEVKQHVQIISNCEDLQERRYLFHQMCQLLSGTDRVTVACLKPLLTDWDFEIRQEAAFWLDAFAVPLSKDEERKLLYAIQQFESLQYGHGNKQKNRLLLLQALKDRSPRVREKVLRVFHLSDCLSQEEEMLYWYGRGDYVVLIQFVKENGLAVEAVKLLKEGLSPQNNIPYHQRQCALALQQLGINVEPVTEHQEKHPQMAVDIQVGQQKNNDPQTPLDLLLEKLEREGILTVDGKIFPEIYVGSVTGRINYKNPCPQTWTSEKRRAQIEPEANSVLYKFDFCQIEPRILLHFLIQNFWISSDDFDPSRDIYNIVGMDNRDAAKRWLNRYINGGLPGTPAQDSPSLQTFKQAVENFRIEQMEICRLENQITTITGRKISVDPAVKNFGGKVLNYLIQGSAADFFNEAVVALDSYLIMEQMPVKIVLLIYDEIWLQAEKANQKTIVQLIEDFLNCVWKRFDLFFPVNVRAEFIKG